MTAEPNTPTIGEALSLLVVDDDEIDRRNYARLLAGTVADIRLAATGAAGLAAMRQRAPDCLLLDYSLPDMTGLEFLDMAAAGGTLPCAVVLVTGRGSESVAVDAMKRGVQDYLSKDRLDADKLANAIFHAVTQASLRRQVAAHVIALTEANAALEREVARRRAAEAELLTAKNAAEQANQAKTRFVAMVTHELRTPLTGILGYAQLLRMEGGLSTRQEARVQAMLQAGRHLLDMVEGVLDFASIEAGRMVLHCANVSVREIGQACIEAVGPIAAEKGLQLSLHSSADVPDEIMTDAARMRQVLLNLLGNAVKYSNAGRVELRLRAGARAGGVRIEVADSGPGIDAAGKAHLFEEFERGAASLSVEGTGLGLAIAARIVGLMGGRLGHEDNAGGGSIFWIEMAPCQDRAAAAAAVPKPKTRQRALLVDDTPMNRDVVGAFLEQAGYDVTLAQDGREAVARATAEKFDLILMDVRMPGMDGLEATRRIRALPPARGLVPILALTAHALLDQAAQCLDAGMDGFITKPVDYATMVRAILDAVGQAAIRVPAAALAPSARADRADCIGFAQTLSQLPPDEAAATLRSLRLRTEQLVTMLDDKAEPGLLRETACALAGVANTFGFGALSAAAGDWEDYAQAAPRLRAVLTEIDHIRGALNFEAVG